MKYLWEETDVIPGLVVRSIQTTAKNAVFIVGYRRVNDGNQYLLIDLADGLVVAHEDGPAEMAKLLNRGYRPYRLMLVEQDYDKFADVRAS